VYVASTAAAGRWSTSVFLKFALALRYDSKITSYHEKKVVDHVHALDVMMAESGLGSPEHKESYRILHLDHEHKTVSEKWAFLLRVARINLARKIRLAGKELMIEGTQFPHLAVA